MSTINKAVQRAVAIIVVCLSQAAFSDGSFTIGDKTIQYSTQLLVDQLDHPWDMAVIDDDDFLITERSGQLRRYTQGKLSEPIEGLPDIFVMSQGGLFDVELHPDFKANQVLFLSFAAGTLQANTTRVIRAKLQDQHLIDIQVLFEVEPYKDTPVHFGGRLAVLPDNTLLITTGDGFDYREQAQKLDNLLGKVVRINFDGSIPVNNPFVNKPKTAKSIWTYGHRNPQGLIYDAKRDAVILHEHGPKGGDEVNLLKPGKNYGWPIATYGKDYSGANISPFTDYPNTEQPILHWTPSIAPSGLAVYYGEMFSELNGHLLVGALVDREVKLVLMDQLKVKRQMSLWSEFEERIRTVEVGTEGEVYLLTDHDEGKLYKISRKNM